MFTGIIENTGRVLAFDPTASGHRLVVDVSGLQGPPGPGDSVAINGVCLTAVVPDAGRAAFDVIPESLRRSALADLRPGDRVNLERAMAAGARFDGHFVQGHVDAVATVRRVEARGPEHVLWFSHAADISPLIVPKGSVAVQGVSLTIAEVAEQSFSVALIPTTRDGTTLGDLQSGQRVNIETDLLARAVAHQLDLLRRERSGEDFHDLLQRQGFA